jgi:O-antigen/teichoic acid export membrane protein
VSEAMKQKVVRGGLWSLVENVGSQSLTFVVFVVLARILEPAEFGLAALASVFTALALIFSNQGLSDALVQKEDLQPEHLDATYWVNNAMALLAAIICFVAAPWVARVFGEPELAALLRVLCISFVFNALGLVHFAMLRRELRFRSLAIRRLVSALIGGIVGLVMAWQGYGVWSLIMQQVVNSFVSMIFLIAGYRWHPRLQFSRPHFVELFHFSSHTLGTNLMNFAMLRADRLLIGFFLGKVSLGYYALAQQLIGIMALVFVGSISGIAFPLLSRYTDAIKRQGVFTAALKVTCLVAFPAFCGLMLTAHVVVPAVFGQGWIPAVPLIQILAVTGFFYAVFYLVDALAMAGGRADWVFRVNLLNVTLYAIAFFIAVPFGVVAVAIAFVARGALVSPARAFMACKLLPEPLKVARQAILKPLMITVVMAAGLVALQSFSRIPLTTTWWALILAGMLFYGMACLLFDRRFLFRELRTLGGSLRAQS